MKQKKNAFRIYYTILLLITIISCNSERSNPHDSSNPKHKPGEIHLYKDTDEIHPNGEFNFGFIETGTSIRKTFTIKNEGTGYYLSLTGDPPVSLITDDLSFSVISQPVSMIKYNDTSDFVIEFMPLSKAEKTASIYIKNNGLSGEDFIFTIKGTGGNAKIIIKHDKTIIPSGGSFNFNNILPGNNIQQAFDIMNEGNCDLKITNASITGKNSELFKIVGFKNDIIKPGEKSKFTIIFESLGYGKKEAKISINYNTHKEFTYWFQISGNAIGISKVVVNEASQHYYFGKSVSISGDYAIVSAPYHNVKSGYIACAAYIFHNTDINSWGSIVKILAPGAESDPFGSAVSISDDYAIIGAKCRDENDEYTGAAYIFHRTNRNSWDNWTKIPAPDADGKDYFGKSVSISGDYAIVGAYKKNYGKFSGAAYIFHRTNRNSWDSGNMIVAPDAEAAISFGSSVSISGDYAIVGAPYCNQITTNAGAAYIFHRTDTNSWDSGIMIVAHDASPYDNFGSSVSISGDYAIVGVPNNDQMTTNAGAAYIFHRTDTNSWDNGNMIVAHDPMNDDYFGSSVSISGDYTIIGAHSADVTADDFKIYSTGAAYIFHRNSTTINYWDNWMKILAPDSEEGDFFGNSVSISGDYAISGAQYEDQSGFNAGAAYILRLDPYINNSKIWPEINIKFDYTPIPTGGIYNFKKRTCIGNNKQQKFRIRNDGNCVLNLTNNPKVVITGTDAALFSVTVQPDDHIAPGTASDFTISFEPDIHGKKEASVIIYNNDVDESTYSFRITGIGSNISKLLADKASEYDFFGNSVSISGDYAIVGAPYSDESATNAGAAYIFHRNLNRNSWDNKNKIVAPDVEAAISFGSSVSISGNYAIVGCINKAYIFYRKDTNSWDTGNMIVAPDSEATLSFGSSVSISGNYAIVGAPYSEVGATNAGAAYIFRLNSKRNSWIYEGKILAPDARDWKWCTFGRSVSMYGDYVIVGAHGMYNSSENAGAAYIFHRDSTTNSWICEGKILAPDAQEDDYFGNTVSICSDYAIVGAPYYNVKDFTNAGAAYIFHRKSNRNSWTCEEKILAPDAQEDDYFGYSVSISNDYAIIGGRYEDEGDSNAGSAYIFHRKSNINSWICEEKILAPDAQEDDYFGNAVSISENLAIVGAIQEDEGGSNAGAAYIFVVDESR